MDLFLSAVLAAQISIDQQRAAIEKQRVAVRLQIRNAHAGNSFFTVPWNAAPPEPVGMPEQDCEPVPEDEIGPLVEEISRREGLTPDLLRAVIRKESGFIPCAVSRKGAQGLMQLMPETASELGVDDPFDPEQNVAAGAKYLKQLLTRYGGNVALGLGAYNAGPTRIDAFRGLPPFPETVTFVADILGKIGERRDSTRRIHPRSAE